jgi:hypothetical protein
MIYATPVGTYHERTQAGADIRIEKVLRLRSANLGLYGDLYNVANRIVAARTNNVSGSSFGQTRSFSPPASSAQVFASCSDVRQLLLSNANAGTCSRLPLSNGTTAREAGPT